MTLITNTANVCDCTVIYCHMTDSVLQFSILAFIQYCTVIKIHCQNKKKDHGQWTEVSVLNLKKYYKFLFRKNQAF